MAKQLGNDWALEMYKTAQKTIGQYDGYVLRCKQFLVPVIGAVILAAKYAPKLWSVWIMLLAGLGSVLGIFSVEMSVRTVLRRLMQYAYDLECWFDLSSKGNDYSIEPKKDLRFAHYLRRDPAKTWKELWETVRWGVCRHGVIIPYIIAAIIVSGGVLLVWYWKHQC